MALSVPAYVTLANGIRMPTLGLGVWKMKEGEETEQAVRVALHAGYRLIDTAKLYGNERSVGRAVRESGLPREEIFVTTKLFPTDALDPEGAFEKSFERLGLDYIDLYLIHWPVPLAHARLWRSLERFYEEKRVRAIGVSNYGIRDLEVTLEGASVPPMVNQIEFNPFAYQKEVLEFSQAKGIVVEAYSPLTVGRKLRHPVIAEVARRHNRSPAQILIRWALQHGTVVIPKSSHEERIRENIDVFGFELSESDMAELDALRE